MSAWHILGLLGAIAWLAIVTAIGAGMVGRAEDPERLMQPERDP